MKQPLQINNLNANMLYRLIYVISICCLVGCGVLPKGISYVGEERVFGKSFNRTFTTLRRDAENWEPAWELGIAIKPQKDGRIKGIRIKNPTAGYVRLSVWDADTKLIIQTLNANISDTLNYNFIFCEIPITANKTYCISINVRKYYYYNLPFNPLPLNVNNISLLYSVYEETPYQRFPQNNVASVYHGLIDLDVDFKTN
ncbi:MAG: DUF4082 domain-containing protein [Ferruginibacter sp.]|nr:DUF4082 domain-containing protein [Ferruginibacter sp.]